MDTSLPSSVDSWKLFPGNFKSKNQFAPLQHKRCFKYLLIGFISSALFFSLIAHLKAKITEISISGIYYKFLPCFTLCFTIIVLVGYTELIQGIHLFAMINIK